jgi:3-phytase
MSRLALLLALAALLVTPAVASIETTPLFDDEAGGEADADHPAVWIHPHDRRATLVLGTKKNAGLDVYALDGRTIPASP